MDQDYLALVHKIPIPIHPISTLSKLTRSIALINNPINFTLSRNKFSKIIIRKLGSTALFSPLEKSKVRSRDRLHFFPQSVNCHACYVSNRWKPFLASFVAVIPTGRRPPPIEILIGDTHVLGTCKPAFRSKRGGGIIFYRVFNNSWYPRCWIIGAEGNRTGYEGTMARRLIIRRMATGGSKGRLTIRG